MENNNTKVKLIEVKVIPVRIFYDFKSWLDSTQLCRNKHGITTPMLHQDCNGFATNGFDLRNTKKETPYPVKSYILVKDPDIPLLFITFTVIKILALAIIMVSKSRQFHLRHRIIRLCSCFGVGVTYLGVGSSRTSNLGMVTNPRFFVQITSLRVLVI